MRSLAVLLSLSLAAGSLPAAAMPMERWLPDSSPTIKTAHAHFEHADQPVSTVRAPSSAGLPKVSVPAPAALLKPGAAVAPLSAEAATAAAGIGGASPLVQAESLRNEAEAAPVGDGERASDAVWSNGRDGSPDGPAVPSSSRESPAPRRSFLSRLTRPAVAGATALGVAVIPSPGSPSVQVPAQAEVALHQLTPWMPYAIVAGGLVATHYASKAARWAVDVWTKRAKTDESTAELLRLAATVMTWGAGATLTLHIAGVSLENVLAGVGGVGGAVAVIIGQEIGNFIEGAKVLIARPFRRGDKVRKGGVDYAVERMETRFVDLSVWSGSAEPNEYRQLSSNPITVLRPYQAPTFVKRQIVTTSLWLGLSLAAVFGVPWLVGLAHWGWLTTLLPWLKTGAIMFATRRFELWAAALVDKILTALKRPRPTIDAWTFIARAVTYLAGMTFILRAFDISWLGAMTSVGVSSLVLGYIVGDTVRSLYYGVKILFTQPFRVGDVILVSGVTGRVAEMNLFYVVLEHKEKTHTLIPYAVFKDNPVIRLSAQDADTSMPKLTPSASLPPSQRDSANTPPKK